MDTETEMPYCWMHRVFDEDELSSVREHVAEQPPKLRETYREGVDEHFDGEEIIIVSWPVKDPNKRTYE